MLPKGNAQISPPRCAGYFASHHHPFERRKIFSDAADKDNLDQTSYDELRPPSRSSGNGYIELNPVRAGLVQKPESWQWRSAGAHLKGWDDILVKTEPLLQMVSGTWKRFLSVDAKKHEIDSFKKHERTGRPLGEDGFIEALEVLLNRKLKGKKPGPRKR